MKLIIEISDASYETVKNGTWCGSLYEELKNGTPLTESEDCISRQAMHIELEKWITYGEYKYSNATKYLYDRIDRLPTVNPVEKVGQWVKTIGENGVTSAVRCSKCGFEDNRYMLFRYCPNCGAKMEGE